MRVLITGGAGFIGSHVAEEFIRNGDEVFVLDDLSTGSLENVCHLQGSEAFHIEVDSVLNKGKTAELVRGCDMVIHLAAAVGVKHVLGNLLESFLNNIQGTQLILELCDRFEKKVLITSSSEVYGKHTHAPLREQDNLVYGPSTSTRWGYAVSKLMGEFLALAYHRERSLKVIIVRLFNTVGPRQVGRYGMVLPRFVEWALKGKPIEVYGDGSQTRTFIYVKDVARAIRELVEDLNAYGEVVNLGGTEEVSVLELARKVKERAGSNSEIRRVPYEIAYGEGFEDIQRRLPDLEKLKRITGWTPRMSLEEIIDQVIEYVSGGRKA